MWLSSHYYRVAMADVKDELLSEVLGWNRPVSGKTATHQLNAIRDKFNNGDETQRLLSKDGVAVASVALLECLQQALEDEAPAMAEFWMKDLRDRPVIWLGGSFVEPSRLAFNPLANFSNTEPFLYVVTSELTQYATLLKALGEYDIPPSPPPPHFSALLNWYFPNKHDDDLT
jgi:hypothetical protein